jgi:Zn finger protein HypA/HybF involved in hydrogenase expression
MHEMSIAESILEIARRHTPDGQRLIAVSVRAGPLRAIDESAMALAWQATTAGSPAAGCRLDLNLLPWHLRCPECGHHWLNEERFDGCPCGCETPGAIGGDELQLTRIEVEPLADAATVT